MLRPGGPLKPLVARHPPWGERAAVLSTTAWFSTTPALPNTTSSPFISDDMHKLPARWDVFPLFSPPRTPQ